MQRNMGGFSFSVNEKKGIIVLVILILLLFTTDYFLFDHNEKMVYDYSAFEAEVDDFYKSVDANKVRNKEETSYKNKQKVSSGKDVFIPPQDDYRINPNTASEEEWLKIGLNKKQVHVINNYLEAGGTFYRKEDLRKIYSINSQTYSKIIKYIHIPGYSISNEEKQKDRTDFENIREESESSETFYSVELNSADTVHLMMIRGIGPVYANRICRYRDLLGGYRKIEQLTEVYGITDTLFNRIKDYLEVDTTHCSKINLNTADFNQIIRHPYMNKYQTNAILKYRRIKGKIEQVEELREYNILTEKTYKKIEGYLTCD